MGKRTYFHEWLKPLADPKPAYCLYCQITLLIGRATKINLVKNFKIQKQINNNTSFRLAKLNSKRLLKSSQEIDSH